MLNFTTLLPFASGQLPRQRCGSAISAGRVWLFRLNSKACARGLPRYCGAGEKESKRHFLEGGGTGRRLPTRRRSCPLPGGTRTEGSTQGKARAGHGLPGRPCWSDTGEWRPLPTAARPGSQRGGARRAPGPFGREGAPPRSVGTALSGAWVPGRCESGTQRPSRVLVSMTGRRRCCPAGDRVGTAADRAAAQAPRRVTACAGHRGGPRPSQPCCHGPHGPGPAGGSVCLRSSSAQLRERRGFRPRTVPEMTSLDSAGYYQNAQVCTGSYVYRLGLNLVLLLLSKNGSLSKESYKSEVNFTCRSLISSSNSSPTLTGALPSSLTCINIPVTLSDLHLGYESESHRAPTTSAPGHTLCVTCSLLVWGGESGLPTATTSCCGSSENCGACFFHLEYFRT